MYCNCKQLNWHALHRWPIVHHHALASVRFFSVRSISSLQCVAMSAENSRREQNAVPFSVVQEGKPTDKRKYQRNFNRFELTKYFRMFRALCYCFQSLYNGNM